MNSVAVKFMFISYFVQKNPTAMSDWNERPECSEHREAQWLIGIFSYAPMHSRCKLFSGSLLAHTDLTLLDISVLTAACLCFREPQIDLQLPTSNVVEEKMLTVHAEPKIKFKEKTVSSLKDNLPAVFKKKKKGIGYRNLKARTDDL